VREVLARIARANPSIWRVLRAVRHEVNNRLPPRRVDGIIGPVHRNDTMLRATGRHRYHRTAVETIELFEAQAGAAGVDLASATWFEIGCGYGRLVRVLSDRIDPARVTVCDVDPDASRFCERTFGVRRSLSDPEFRFHPPVAADVVYALSVATHLPWDGFERFLAAGFGALRPGGVFLFSTHGDVALGQLGVYDEGRYLPFEEELRAGYEGSAGFGYTPYAYEPEAGYGMAWHRWEAVVPVVEAAAGGPGAVEITVAEAAIEGHQDLWTCRLVSP